MTHFFLFILFWRGGRLPTPKISMTMVFGGYESKLLTNWLSLQDFKKKKKKCGKGDIACSGYRNAGCISFLYKVTTTSCY